MVALEHQHQVAIGIDIGGTKTLVALIDRSGTMIEKIEFPTMPQAGADVVIQKLHDTIESLLTHMPSDGELLGIGIATAGVIDSTQNVILYASNLGWENVDVGTKLEKSFGVPVRLGNDGNLAGVAEYVWGAEKKVKDLIYITVSTGIGAGIISGGQLVQGRSDSAGEFGHISFDIKGPRCSCGNYGCLENYCSGTAIARMANERLGEHPSGKAWGSREVLEAVNAGDQQAIDLIHEAAFYLGNGIVSLIHLFNPSQIIFGGGVMSTENELYHETLRVAEERCLPSMYKHVTFRRTSLGKEIGVLGAAGLFYMDSAK